MSSKYKATGCARFFLVLIILAPLAYLGASYYNGQDGLENVKNILGIGDNDSDNASDTGNEAVKNADTSEPSTDNTSGDEAKQSEEETIPPVENTEDKSDDQTEQINALTKENQKLKQEHQDFQKRLKALEDENKALKTRQDTSG